MQTAASLVLTAVVVAVAAAVASPAAPASAAWSAAATRRGGAPYTQTYLGELRLRSIGGEQLACTRSLLHDPYSADHGHAEGHLCDAVRQAIAATGAAFALVACSVDRFVCDHGLPLAQARLRFGGGGGGDNDTLSMAAVHSQLSLELLTRARLVRMDYMQITDYNECGGGGANECSADATCYNKVGSYACVCKRNFVDLATAGSGDEGRRCAPKCGAGYCANGGRCADASSGECRCPEQYSGGRCEVLKHDLVTLWVVASSLTVVTTALLPLTVWLCCRLNRRTPRGVGGTDRKAYRALA